MKARLTHIIRTHPLFLYLLVLFFVFHCFTENYDLIPVKDAIILAMFYIGVGLVIALSAWLLYRNFRKANLIAFLILGYQFFFGSAQDFLRHSLPGSFFSKYSFILPASFAALIIIVVILKKTKRSLVRATFYLNSLFLILLFLDIARLILKLNLVQHTTISHTEILLPCDSCKKPDIFLIIADGYPGNIELRDLFHYDNSLFETELRKRGFHIVDSSSSNYNFTGFSIASMLNMNYLEGIEGDNNSKKDLSICSNTIKQNLFLQYLGQQGYAFYNYSIFDFDHNPSVTHPTFLPLKTRLVTSQTFTSRVVHDLWYHLATTLKISAVIKRYKTGDLRNNEKLYALTEKIAAKQIDRPKFVYTHLMMPHHPFYFDSTGTTIPLKMLEGDYYYNKDMRISYLKYCNKKFLVLIDHILGSSASPPVILFMGDHGIREFSEQVDNKYTFMNLNAILMPDSNYAGFYKGQSNINQLRIFLNLQFHQRLPLLPDSTSFLRTLLPGQ